MAKKKIIPGIHAITDEEGLVFYCEGEPIEDMEFTWEDLTDSDLLMEVAEELVEYLEDDEADELDNPLDAIVKKIKRLRDDHVGKKENAEEEEFDADAEVEEDDDDEE